MIIFDLTCPAGHTFEGWFDGREEFAREREAGRLTCPLCGDGRIEVVPSGAHVGGRSRPPALSRPQGAAATALAALAEALERNFEDVGGRFAEEALRMHCGEADPRNIRGVMTGEEEKRLEDEGVEYAKIPLPRFSS